MKITTVRQATEALAAQSSTRPGTVLWRIKIQGGDAIWGPGMTMGPVVYPSGPRTALALVQSRGDRHNERGWSLIEVRSDGPARLVKGRNWNGWQAGHKYAIDEAARLARLREDHDSEHGRYDW